MNNFKFSLLTVLFLSSALYSTQPARGDEPSMQPGYFWISFSMKDLSDTSKQIKTMKCVYGRKSDNLRDLIDQAGDQDSTACTKAMPKVTGYEYVKVNGVKRCYRVDDATKGQAFHQLITEQRWDCQKLMTLDPSCHNDSVVPRWMDQLGEDLRYHYWKN
jgi:hypothetical protein